jgi:hypothetical protein
MHRTTEINIVLHPPTFGNNFIQFRCRIRERVAEFPGDQDMRSQEADERSSPSVKRFTPADESCPPAAPMHRTPPL